MRQIEALIEALATEDDTFQFASEGVVILSSKEAQLLSNLLFKARDLLKGIPHE